MTDDLSWNSALCVAGLRLTNEERAAGWPVAFTPENLACLQYPWGGSASEKKDSTNKRRVLLATILKAIHSGALPAEERTRIEDITESRQEPGFFPPNSPYSGGFGSPDWRNRDRPRPMRTVTTKVGERTVPFFVIERAAFQAWLAKNGLEPSEHVRAWLGAVLPLKKVEVGARRETKMERFLMLLEQIESAWMESGREEINRRAWPGTSKELWALAVRLEPKPFGESTPDSFYQNYPRKAGLCFNREKGTGAVYEELFPPLSAAKRSAA